MIQTAQQILLAKLDHNSPHVSSMHIIPQNYTLCTTTFIL